MTRVADYPIDPMFTHRWSSRAMNGEPVSDAELSSLLEAARWAPSAGNTQPWRFAYAKKGTSFFQPFFDLLNEGNRPWAERAGALLVVSSTKVSLDGKHVLVNAPNDVGAAWMSFALQASKMGLVTHGIGGFDRVRAREVIGANENIDVHMMIVVGHPGSADHLLEKHKVLEAPNARRPVSSFAFEGKLPEDA